MSAQRRTRPQNTAAPNCATSPKSPTSTTSLPTAKPSFQCPSLPTPNAPQSNAKRPRTGACRSPCATNSACKTTTTFCVSNCRVSGSAWTPTYSPTTTTRPNWKVSTLNSKGSYHRCRSSTRGTWRSWIRLGNWLWRIFRGGRGDDDPCVTP